MYIFPLKVDPILRMDANRNVKSFSSLHSERPKLSAILTVPSARGLKVKVSNSLVDTGAVGVRDLLYLGHSKCKPLFAALSFPDSK